MRSNVASLESALDDLRVQYRELDVLLNTIKKQNHKRKVHGVGYEGDFDAATEVEKKGKKPRRR